jgi:hypothetical protein
MTDWTNKLYFGDNLDIMRDYIADLYCVMIDLAYNGEVFNVGLSDVPPKKDDLVTGRYTLPARTGRRRWR